MNTFNIWSKFKDPPSDSPCPVKTECLNPTVLMPDWPGGWAGIILKLDDSGRFTIPSLPSMTRDEAELYMHIMHTQIRGRKYSEECARAIILLTFEYTRDIITLRDLNDGLRAVAVKVLSDPYDSFPELVEWMKTPNDQMRRLWKDLQYIVKQYLIIKLRL